MASSSTAGATGTSSSSDMLQDIYIPALQNTLALEKQSEQMMERQLERYERYPEMIQALPQHHQETEQQIQRLEQILHSHGADRSLLKDTATQLAGDLGALFHSAASDDRVHASDLFIPKNRPAVCAEVSYWPRTPLA